MTEQKEIQEQKNFCEFSVGYEVLSVRETEDAKMLKVLHGATVRGKEAYNRPNLSYISIQDDELVACNGLVMVWVKKKDFVRLFDYLPEQVNGVKLVGVRFAGSPKKGENIIQPIYSGDGHEEFPDNYMDIKNRPTLTKDDLEKLDKKDTTMIAMNPQYIHGVLGYLKGSDPMTFEVFTPVHPVFFKCGKVCGIIMPMHLGSW